MNNKIIRMKKQVKLSGRILSMWWKCWLVRYVDVRKGRRGMIGVKKSVK